MDKTETSPEQDQTPQQLGELLKSYRESANMDIAQAADTLCLAEGTLVSLENEEFDKLPEAPYLRGYLRGYAKLANVNSSEVIALYESMRGENSAASDAQYNFSPSSSIENYNKPLIPPYLVQLGTLAVVFLVFSIIYMIPGVKEWTGDIWDKFSQQNVVAENNNTEATPKPIEQASLNVSSTETSKPTHNVAAVDLPEQESNSPDKTVNTVVANATENSSSKKMEGTITRQDSDAKNEPSKSDETDTKDTEEIKQQVNNQNTNSTTDSTNDSTNVATAPTTATEQSETTEAAVDSEIQSPTSSTSDETTPVDLTSVDASAGEVMVKLVFKEEVWMRVNSNSKKVFSGLKKSGDAEEFKTQKPLSFKVGNAPGVDIYINGKLYDQTPHIKGVVAKFKVENI